MHDQSPSIWAGRSTQDHKRSTGYGTLPDFTGLECIMVWYADCVRGQTGGGFKQPCQWELAHRHPEWKRVQLRCCGRVRAAKCRAFSRLEESYEEG
jgi:hypothetical protein